MTFQFSDGPRPFEPLPPRRPGNGLYQPMKKQGAIILATGGDASNSAEGSFCEPNLLTSAAAARQHRSCRIVRVLNIQPKLCAQMRASWPPATLLPRPTRQCRPISSRWATRPSRSSSTLTRVQYLVNFVTNRGTAKSVTQRNRIPARNSYISRKSPRLHKHRTPPTTATLCSAPLLNHARVTPAT